MKPFMLYVAYGFSLCILAVLSILLLSSGDKVKPFLDEHGQFLKNSISEKTFVDINGDRQGMFIKGRNISNPVLLFLHGGPSLPEIFLTKDYPSGLEDYFTVCWWDQRGAGISYNSNSSPQTITFDQLIADTKAVTNYLRTRFNKEKIYLLGHSGGSFIGIQVVSQEPALYYAYIAVAQITQQLESEKLAYKYIYEQYKKAGNQKMLNKIRRFQTPEQNNLPAGYRAMHDETMHDLGIGTMRKMKSIIKGVFLPSLFYKEYTLAEKINLWRGKWAAYSDNLFNEIIKTDITAKVSNIEIPVYFLHGAYDYTVSYTLAKSYYEKIKAPLKGFYTFYNSAHSPVFEEPDRLKAICISDIMNGVNALADTTQ